MKPSTYLFLIIMMIETSTYSRPHCSSFGQHSYGGAAEVKSWGEGTHYSVGKFCSIADCLTIFLGGNHRVDWISTYPFPAFASTFPEVNGLDGFVATHGNVVIGNDVWIGSHVTILSGVTIGDGAVIGAYSVVAKSIPPYAIAVGNPARVVRYRFDEETIHLLLKLQWWNWPIETIRKNAPLLCSDNIQEFLQRNADTRGPRYICDPIINDEPEEFGTTFKNYIMYCAKTLMRTLDGLSDKIKGKDPIETIF